MKKSVFKRQMVPMLALASSLGVTLPVYAQESSSGAGFSLEEVVVTARKREESMQDAPISITAATGNDLKYRQIDSGDRLGQITPNLDFSSQSPSSGNNASSQVFLRGVGQTDFLPTTDPGVGIYVDGVYLARSTGGSFDFLDIERIEVLRGPQGTLFGRNTIGGAINVISSRPNEEFGGIVKAKVGTDSLIEFAANIDVPFSESFLSKFSLLQKKRDGYVTRISDGEDLGDDNSMSVRARFLWALGEDTDIDLIVDYTDQDENGAPLVMNSIGTTGPTNAFATYASFVAGCPGQLAPLGPNASIPNIDDPRCANNFWVAGPFKTNGTFDTSSQHEEWGINLTAQTQLGSVDFKSITAYRDSDSHSSTDADGTPLDVFDRVNDDFQNQFSQEFQLSGMAIDDRLVWLLGAYYFEEEAEDVNVVRLAGGGFQGPPGVVGGLGVLRIGGLVENDTQAVFSQVTFDVTEAFSITAGLRYSEETKEFTSNTLVLETEINGSARFLAEAGCFLVPTDINDYPLLGNGFADISIANGCPTSESQLVKQSFDISETTAMLTFSYEWTENLMTYASYSEGFKSGGFGSRVVAPVLEAKPFAPEFVETLEAGLKGTFFDNSLRVNGAIFSTEYTDQQIVIRQDFNPVPFNAGESTIEGAELELTFIPNDQWLISAGFGVLDASYDSLSDEVIAAGLSVDFDLPHVPDLTANLGVAYNIYIENLGILTPRLDWSYQSSMFFDANNSNAIAADSREIINAAVIFTSTDEVWEATLGVNNATDEIYRVAGNQSLTSAASYAESVYARPREWFLDVQYNF